jgi:hypothetical protein
MAVKVLALITALLTALAAAFGLKARSATEEQRSTQVIVQQVASESDAKDARIDALRAENDQLKQQIESLRRTGTAPSPAPSPGNPANPANPAIEYEGDVNWTTSTREYLGKIGRVVSYTCPPRGIAQQIWGTDLYTFDSSVCTAAVHAGRISLADGGVVKVQIREGAQQYQGSKRNGIASNTYGSYSGSFEFVS